MVLHWLIWAPGRALMLARILGIRTLRWIISILALSKMGISQIKPQVALAQMTIMACTEVLLVKKITLKQLEC